MLDVAHEATQTAAAAAVAAARTDGASGGCGAWLLSVLFNRERAANASGGEGKEPSASVTISLHAALAAGGVAGSVDAPEVGGENAAALSAAAAGSEVGRDGTAAVRNGATSCLFTLNGWPPERAASAAARTDVAAPDGLHTPRQEP